MESDITVMEFLDGEVIDLLAVPARCRSFPTSFQILWEVEKTISFRNKSDVRFGPENIEFMTDDSMQH